MTPPSAVTSQPAAFAASTPAPPNSVARPFLDALTERLQAGGGGGPPLGVTQAADAVARGERNLSRLTDIVFNARHADRSGRPIAPGDWQAAREWLWLRDGAVAPALRSIDSTTVVTPQLPSATSSAAEFMPHVPVLRRFTALAPLLERYRGDIPLWFLLGWVAVESGAVITDTTSLDERGFFQIHPDESKGLRPPVQHLRLSTDPAYSAQAGIQLVRYYAELARRRFPWIPYGTELFWRVVKLQHAMGSPSAYRLLTIMRSRGIPTTWEAIRQFEAANGPALAADLKVSPRYFQPPGRFSHNVDELVARGRRIAGQIGR